MVRSENVGSPSICKKLNAQRHQTTPVLQGRGQRLVFASSWHLAGRHLSDCPRCAGSERSLQARTAEGPVERLSVHKVGVFWMYFSVLNDPFKSSAATWTTVACASGAREYFSKDFPMTLKTIATLLILSAFATTGANPASAQGNGFGGSGFRAGGSHGGGGGNFKGRGSHGNGFHGRGFHGRGFHGRGFVGFGLVDGYGSGYGNGYPDWYGITPGYDECPLFRQRVMTRDGWRVRMIPIC